MKVKENVPLLTVSNIQESHQFYCDVLGFSEVQQWEEGSQLVWCRIEHGGAALMLQQASKEELAHEGYGKGIVFYFICEDADIAYRAISERGGKATEPKVAFYGMKQTFITDPDGYKLCFESQTEEA